MIRFGFYTSNVVLSSDLPDITVFTDHDFVDVRLSAYGNILLAGRYYALNGSAKVSDISSLVGEFLAGNTDEPLCECRIEAFIGEEEAELTGQSFTVLYCDKVSSSAMTRCEGWRFVVTLQKKFPKLKTYDTTSTYRPYEAVLRTTLQSVCCCT